MLMTNGGQQQRRTNVSDKATRATAGLPYSSVAIACHARIVVGAVTGSLDGLQRSGARVSTPAPPLSVSNLSAHMHRHAARSTVSPRLPTPMSCSDVVRGVVGEGGVWDLHSLHTAEVVGSNPTTPTQTEEQVNGLALMHHQAP